MGRAPAGRSLEHHQLEERAATWPVAHTASLTAHGKPRPQAFVPFWQFCASKRWGTCEVSREVR